MSFPDVLDRGDEFLSQYPRTNPFWQIASHGTCLLAVGISKFMLNTFYNVKLNNLEKLQEAVARTKTENRGLMTVMNHMSVVDDPFIWGVFPWSMYWDLDQIRWCLGAHNVCFQNKFLATFFSLGKVLSTERFGGGPFQGSIDASIRLLSPDDTLDLEWTPHHIEPLKKEIEKQPTLEGNNKIFDKLSVKDGHVVKYVAPVARSKPSWIHVYPEGFVLQLQPPFSNSMRYFRWGITRLILESTKSPIVVPMFSTGFEKIAPESSAGIMIERYLPRNMGAEINVTIGNPIDDAIIDGYRKEWLALCDKYHDPKNPTDLSWELKYGKEVQDLRSRLAAELRAHVAKIRHEERRFELEDERFKSAAWWGRYTETEGASDPDVKFIGQNWAIRRLQKFLNDYDDAENPGKHE